MKELAKKLEAILFLSGEPSSLEKLSRIVKEPKEKLREALEELARTLESEGLRLSEKDEEYMLVTAPEFGKFFESFLEEELGSELSRATLETLAVIVYKGPLSRSEIEYIRGVNSSFTIRNLMIRGLIEREAHPTDSRVWLYKPTFEFLKFMGIEKLGKLPQYSEFREEMERLLRMEREPKS